MTERESPYPKPGETGGRLVRELIAGLRTAGLELPIASHILIAVSGGCDSVALAHALLKYGRRAIADRSRIRLLHVDHGWRGDASRQDAEFVRDFGRQWGVAVAVHTLSSPTAESTAGRSWEDLAREARKGVFRGELGNSPPGSVLLTAHQADDVAETVLWRLLTGASETHGAGIAPRHGQEVRPLLGVRKSTLTAYLIEEGQSWREDSTNHAGRFLRAQLRQEMMPVVERLFPRGVEHLLKLAERARERGAESAGEGLEATELTQALGALFGVSGVQPRRAHWDAVREASRADSSTRVSLAGGWRLSGDSSRWVLERDEPVPEA